MSRLISREYRLQLQFGPICNFGSKGGDSTSSSANYTSNTSATTTQDRRQVVDSGAGAVNADNSSVNLTVNSLDGGAVNAGITAAQTGAYVAGAVASQAVQSGFAGMQHLADQGTAMLQANTALANSITGKSLDTTLAMQTNSSALANSLNNADQTTMQTMWTGVQSMLNGVLSGAAQNQQTAQTLALTPLTQNNPDRYLIIGALAVVAVVAFTVMNRKG